MSGNLTARRHSLRICTGSYAAGMVRYRAVLFNFLIHIMIVKLRFISCCFRVGLSGGHGELQIRNIILT